MEPHPMHKRRVLTLGEWMLIVAVAASLTRLGQMLWAYGSAGVILWNW
jgi:hypothetical protein